MTLPTPPGTSHRDKENQFPGVPHVVWSPNNLIHDLTAILPLNIPIMASKSKRLPSKSILKHRDHRVLLPILEDNQKESTPEPSNPLTDINYLSSPVSKILDPHSSLRELIESYSILAARLKTSVTEKTDANASWPLFQPIREHREAIIQAFIRDLAKALADPPKSENIPEESCTEDDVASLLLKDNPPKKRGMTAEQVKYARDLCTTCHAVMKLLATVFNLPVVHKIFSNNQLRAVLAQVLVIPMASELPTYNARKTWALSIWLLQVQRLPSEILAPAADSIANALKRGIEGKLGKEGKKGSGSDGLKAIHDLAIYQPSIFIPAFAKIIPPILANLVEPSLALRLQACHALGGLVIGCASLPFSPAHARIANDIATFITTPPSLNATKSSQDPAIIRTLRTTLSTTDPSHTAQGPVWALSVLANFIVLMGPALCMDMKLTKVVSSLLVLSMRHKKNTVRALVCLVWRSVAWVYFLPRLLEFSVDVDGKGRLQMISQTSVKEAEEDIQVKVKQWEAGRENLWTLVKTVVDMGAGVATIAGLLREDIMRDDVLRRVLSLIKVMIDKGGPTCGDAMEMAKRFVSFDIPQPEMDRRKLLPRALFSSVPGLLTASYNALVSALQPIFDQCPQLEDVRPLTRDEVAKDWVIENLVEIWKEGLDSLEMADDVETPIELTGIWEGLLKAKVAVLQDAGDNDGISQFAIQMVEVLITNVLQDPNLDLSPKVGSFTPPLSPTNESKSSPLHPGTPASSSRSNAALKLIVARDLWAITRTIVSPSLLRRAARTLLMTLTQTQNELVGGSNSGDDAWRQWSLFCAETLSICSLDEMTSFWKRKTKYGRKSEWTPNVRCMVWDSFIKTWTKIRPESWERTAVLLGVPFANATRWELSNDDFRSWDELLCYTICQASDCGIDSAAVLDYVADIINQHSSLTFTSSVRVADLLMSRFEIPEARQLPGSLLDLVNDALQSSYPPEPRNKVISMWMIRSLTRLIDTCPAEMAQALLEKMQDGLCLWVSDTFRILSQEEYAFDILPLYEIALFSIRLMTHGVETLRNFSPILVSVFCGRDDKAPSASNAFAEFWIATYSGMDEPVDGWPPSIRICLQSAFGLAVPRGDAIEGGSGDGTDVSNNCADDAGAEELEKGCYADRNTDGDGCQTERRGEPLLVTVLAPVLSPSVGSEIHADKGVLESSGPFSPSHKTRESYLPPTTTAHPMTPPQTPLTSFQSVPLRSPSTPTMRPRTSAMPMRAPSVHLDYRSAFHARHGVRRVLSNKENVSPRTHSPSSPVHELSPSVLSKRRVMESGKVESIAKRMKGRASKLSIGDHPRKAIQTLTLRLPAIPSRVTLTWEAERSEGTFDRGSPVVSKKRKVFMDVVEVPTLQDVQRRKRQRTTSIDFPTPSTLEQPPELLARTSSGNCRASLVGTRKKIQTSSGLAILTGNLIMSSSLAEQEMELPGSDDSVLLSDGSASQMPRELSDDDRFEGQVTPHHLISPAPRRPQTMDHDPPSDDSNMSISPSRDVVARRLERVKSLQQLLAL